MRRNIATPLAHLCDSAMGVECCKFGEVRGKAMLHIEPVGKREPINPTTHGVPERVLHRSDGRGLFAAKWRSTPLYCARSQSEENLLVMQFRNPATICKRVGKRQWQASIVHDMFFFVPQGEGAVWQATGERTSLHIHIPMDELYRIAQSSARAVTIDPFFAIHDRWLRGYFEILASEFDMYGWSAGSSESLLLSQTQAMLLQHLIRWHSDASKPDKRELARQSRQNTIPPLILKRIVTYVNDNLSQSLRLEDLAGLAHQSESHFIESFRASTGCTPYRYVISTRLRTSIDLLRTTDLPIAEVAKNVGFSTSSHYTMLFRREFGITPQRYRGTCRTDVIRCDPVPP